MICNFPMREYASIWYNANKNNFSVECSECFSSYDEHFEIKMPGLIFNYGES